MTIIWSAATLSKALNIEVSPETISRPALAVQYRSDQIAVGDLFIALKTVNVDGHDYAAQAVECGALAVIVSQEITSLPAVRQIKVADTFAALQKLAEYKRRTLLTKFIGVTGSVGKTTTKEMLKIILSAFGPTFATRSNCNNYLGVPLSLASIPEDAEYAVIEMATSQAGELAALTKLVKPDIAVVTTVAEAHLEFFNSVQDIADAKAEIFSGLPPGGKAIINFDNQYYQRLLLHLDGLGVSPNNIYSFGSNTQADVNLASYQNLGSITQITYKAAGRAINLQLPLTAEHNAKNFATCLAVTLALDLDLELAAKQLAQFKVIKGRGKMVNAKLGNKTCQLIDDCYNASPTSVRASLEYFRQISHPKKVIIIGDMLALGPKSSTFHKNLLPSIIASGAQKVWLVGTNVGCIYQSLPNNIESIWFDDAESLIQTLDKLIDGDELILIKASRAMRLDKIIDAFQVAS